MNALGYPPRGEFSDDMGDINTMVPPQCRGDDDALRYEAAHRVVFQAAIAWCDAHPDVELSYSTLEADGLTVVGVLRADTTDSRQLIEVMRLAAAEHGGWTGIMIENCMHNLFVVRERGWEGFVDFRRELMRLAAEQPRTEKP